MKEYVILILLLAAVITTVAVAAGAIVYIRAHYGIDSLTFQLSRIGILWGAAILVLILIGAIGACVTGWTINSINDAIAWLLEHNPINDLKTLVLKFLDWGYKEHPWGAWAVLWCVTLLPIAFLWQRHLCTVAALTGILAIHFCMSAYIWQGAMGWVFVQVIVAIVVVGCMCAEGDFVEQLTWRQRRQMQQEERRKAEMAAAAENVKADAPDDPNTPDGPVPDHHRPVEVLGEMVADCFRTLANQQ